MKKIGFIFFVLVSILLTPLMAHAAFLLNLSANPSSGSVNGAFFQVPGSQVSGTGIFDPFLRIQANGTESGYNTDASNPPFDTKKGTWTHSLLLGDLSFVTLGNTNYYEFVLDINETASSPLITLKQLKIFIAPVGDNGSNNTTTISNLGSIIFDLDSGGDSEIQLNYNNFPGSGRNDMSAFIPAALFVGAPTQHVYFYSQFGQLDGTDDGFEEWAVIKGDSNDPDDVVPEPGTLILLGSGLAGLAGYARFRIRRKK